MRDAFVEKRRRLYTRAKVMPIHCRVEPEMLLYDEAGMRPARPDVGDTATHLSNKPMGQQIWPCHLGAVSHEQLPLFLPTCHAACDELLPLFVLSVNN